LLSLAPWTTTIPRRRNFWKPGGDGAKAAKLAERLAAAASKAADEAEQDALASEEIVDLAEDVSRDAGLAATKGRQAATRARRLTTGRRQ
jgi:hypothetical protein